MERISPEMTRNDLEKSRKARMGAGIAATGPERESNRCDPKGKSVD